MLLKDPDALILGRSQLVWALSKEDSCRCRKFKLGWEDNGELRFTL